MSTITIVNPKSLSVDVSHQFLGETRRFRTIKTYSITGWVLDLTNQIGVAGILGDVEQIIGNYFGNGAFVTVNVGGANLGAGRLSSLSFSSGNDVRVKEYDCSFEFFEDVDFGANSDDFFSDLSFSNFKYIQNLTEDVSVSQSSKSVKEFSHSISISVLDTGEESGVLNPFNLAKDLASKLFNSSFSFSEIQLLTGIDDDLSSYSCSTNYTESYDSITNQCSFSKNIKIDTDEENKGFARVVTHSLAFDAPGVTRVSETVNYETSSNNPGCYSAAHSDLLGFFGGAFGRCSAVYSEYQSKFKLSNTLFPHFIEKNFQFDPTGGTLGYAVSYSDDLFYKNPGGFWSYVQQAEVASDGIVRVTESGEVIGLGVVKDGVKSKNANNFWKGSVRDGIEGRCSSFFNSKKSKLLNNANCSFPSRLEASQVTKSKRLGTLSYSFTYSYSPTNVDDPNIKSKVVSCTNGGNGIPWIKYNENYLVGNAKEIKSISNSTDQPIEVSSSISIDGKKTESEFGLSNYISKAPDSELCKGDYVSSATYSYSPMEKNFSSSISSVKVNCGN